MSLPTTVKLPSGVQMPAIGLGTWQSAPNEVTVAVKTALENGYTHIDGAAIYQNENEVGQGFRDSGVKRENVFFTSKLWCDCHQPEKVKPALEKTLKDLNMSHIDMYLIHFPLAFKAPGENRLGERDADGKAILDTTVTLEDTWKAMEKLVEAGLTKHIGVSNFNIDMLKRILKISKKGMLSCNQVELHPYLPQNELVDFCKKEGIVVVSYSPLGTGKTPSLIADKTVVEIAEKNKMDVGQVLISWALQRGTVVLPKSVKPERIISNHKVKKLPEEDFEKLNNLHKTAGIHRFVNSIDFFGHDIY